MDYEKKYKELLERVEKLCQEFDNYRADGYTGSVDYQNGKEAGVIHAMLELETLIHRVKEDRDS